MCMGRLMLIKKGFIIANKRFFCYGIAGFGVGMGDFEKR
ncbi:hypothetical protein l11_19030 [Neisseria weaveri LMG 5135]|nr:hypothetical protein l11_19030 [Neisseria weaveri LMG 5135]